MADIVLVKPSVGWYDTIKSHLDVPLGILGAATLVNQEYEVKIIDQQLDQEWKKHIRQELNQNPLLVGMGAMTGEQLRHAIEIAEFVRQEEKKMPIVWGGIHPTLMPEQTIKDARVDYVVKGEGEVTIKELAKSLEKGKSIDTVQGIYYKDNGFIKSTPQRPYADMNELPIMPFELLDMEKYLPKNFGMKSIILESSRGCPFRCTFCRNTTSYFRRWGALRPEKVIELMQHVKEKYGVKAVHFQDENFFTDINRAKETVGLIKTELPDMQWLVNSLRIDTLDRMDRDFLRLIDDSNCIQLKIGVESGSPRILKMIKKDITVEQVIRVNRKLADFKTSPLYNFMCAFPHETVEDIRKTVNLIFKLYHDNKKAKSSAINIYTPYPGTELYDETIKMGFKEPETLDEWSQYSFEKTEPVWLPKEQQRLVKSLFFSSLFMTGYDEEFINSPFIKLGIKLYQPIAKFRTKNMFFKGMIEPKIKEMVVRNYE
ncbi:B12-binding domain-containing radical SAM protein [Candidatus Woesearchaeota archaeon]|nr:B12-binding domain-containing radical SAM protein [Candidatus Woesearchaeota archaeon]